MWMGAHPVAPSRTKRDGHETTLDALIAKDPERELGSQVVGEFGPRLPFLLKVLAAAEPLSLQAHPPMDRARAGFDDEERRGLALSAPDRNYKDRSHKPELLCALTGVDALSGFRALPKTLRLFEGLAVPSFDPVLHVFRSAGIATGFRAWMTLDPTMQTRIVGDVVRACFENRGSPDFIKERAWATRLAELYPGDAGIVSALCLELIHLDPGDAIYLGAGNLHAYLDGVGVEIMASSDNVLRGGLTKKHVDVPELLSVLDYEGAPVIVKPRRIDENESVYDTPAREFRLSRLVLTKNDHIVRREVQGPEILLVTDGFIATSGEQGETETGIGKGDSVFIPASTKRYTLRGSGTLYRATPNLG